MIPYTEPIHMGQYPQVCDIDPGICILLLYIILMQGAGVESSDAAHASALLHVSMQDGAMQLDGELRRKKSVNKSGESTIAGYVYYHV